MNEYLKDQLISYMGNKRKMIQTLSNIIDNIKKDLNKQTLFLADGFSGSGIVSRLLKQHAEVLYTNDIASYSKTLNRCYLESPNQQLYDRIKQNIKKANEFADHPTQLVPKWIRKHWSPQEKNIKKGERVYYTPENARRIDYFRFFIEQLPENDRYFILAPLLVKCSIHTNTSGQFAAFYKKDGVGHYGGKTETDVKRITSNIVLPMPIFSPRSCKTYVSQKDTNQWVKQIPDMDVVYYDPPYNKHPYSIYYFMLEMINNWDTKQKIPETLRGQPKNWLKSSWNSFTHAKKTFEDLIEHTRSKYILVSYNDGGIIPLDEINKILSKKGKVERIPIEHNVYNRMKGIANYKRKKKQSKVKEFIWLARIC